MAQHLLSLVLQITASSRDFPFANFLQGDGTVVEVDAALEYKVHTQRASGSVRNRNASSNRSIVSDSVEIVAVTVVIVLSTVE
jgi:hypothetical protein